MNTYNRLGSLGKAVVAGLLSSGVLLSATARAEVSQKPLSLTEGVAPNMILTLDDSTSMAWGYVPDNPPWDEESWSTSSRRIRAANTNPMYYNPDVVYEIPPNFDSTGKESSFQTSFTSAPENGFRPNGTKINLSDNYRMVHTYQMPGGTLTRANHPADFTCTANFSGTSNGAVRECTNEYGNIRAVITKGRTSSQCTATVHLGISDSVKTVTPSCSISRNTATVSVFSNNAGIPANYYKFDPALDSSCQGKKNEADGGGENCYRLQWVKPEEEQNFANWYSFYKTRALATLSAAGLAFYSLDSSVRFTWQTLNSCWLPSQTTNRTHNTCGANQLRPYSASHRSDFYHWLYNLTDFSYAKAGSRSGTPLRGSLKRAGEFLSDARPWKKDPVANTGESYGCRPAYHVLMTDGMWNVDEGANGHSRIAAPSRPVHQSTTLPDGKAYSQQAPYGNAYQSNIGNTYRDRTLADYAFHYWATDLSSGNNGLANKVPAYIPYKNTNSEVEYWDPRNNPATWQHMSNFIMGLGLSNALTKSPEWSGSAHAGAGYQGLRDNTINWPTPANQHDNNIYDLWHAALNSRGEFFSVDSPEAMVEAFNTILNRIAERQSVAAAPGVSSSLESDGDPDDPQDRLVTYSYQSSYDNIGDWIGDLAKVRIYREWVPGTNGQRGSFMERTENEWRASQSMPAASGRNIKFVVDGVMKDFTENNVEGTDLQSWLDVNPDTGPTQTGRWREAVNYLRGERSKEGLGDNDFRIRSSLLGNFMASQPVIVQRPRYLEQLVNRLEDNTAYTTFIANKKDRAGRIYIGGNAGMLHGFDTTIGKETFAFIPTAVQPKLNLLTGKEYGHQFYVDGSPQVADVYDKEAGVWKTILVGTLRAGGKGLFALDVTTPGEEKLLWEFDEFNYTGNRGYSNDMVGPGYSFPQPVISRLHNGRWAVVTGNGYKGANTGGGKAALYVIDALTGELTKSLEVQGGNAENGLSSPRLADYDGDGIADYAYAGDLQGNLWRFDLLGVGASSERNPAEGSIYGNKTGDINKFAVSYGGKPMFSARSTAGGHVQAITAAPSMTRHPSGKGYLVVFGTGKYFEEGDKEGTTNHAQSLYAVWDRQTRAETTNATGMPIARTALQAQTITRTNVTSTNADGQLMEARTVSNNAVGYYNAQGQEAMLGWYLDLANGTSYEGEMMIENMIVVGSTLLVSTLVPNEDPCAHGAGNWLYALNPATGGRTLNHAFTQWAVDDAGNRVIVSALKHGQEGGIAIRQREDGSIVTSDGLVDIDPFSNRGGKMRPGRGGTGSDGSRQGWRFIPEP